MRPRSATGATDENPRRVITAGTSRLEARQPGLRLRFRWDFHLKLFCQRGDPLSVLPWAKDLGNGSISDFLHPGYVKTPFPVCEGVPTPGISIARHFWDVFSLYPSGTGFLLHKDLAVRRFGGYSLLVLAR